METALVYFTVLADSHFLPKHGRENVQVFPVGAPQGRISGSVFLMVLRPNIFFPLQLIRIFSYTFSPACGPDKQMSGAALPSFVS